jgi:hypothetical protein
VPEIGEQITCGCGAVYEFGLEGKRIRRKDDARCEFCHIVLTAWPLSLSWRVVKYGQPRSKISEE